MCQPTSRLDVVEPDADGNVMVECYNNCYEFCVSLAVCQDCLCRTSTIHDIVKHPLADKYHRSLALNARNVFYVELECSNEHVPRMELPAGVGSCSTHQYSTSVCLKLVSAASTTTFVTSDDKLQTKMAVDGSTDAKKLARTLLSTAAWAS